MKKIFVYMASAALMFAVSCNKEEVNVDTPATVETELITVELNPMTKTALGEDGATTWDADDEVSVTVDGNNVGTLTLVEGTSSTFSGEITAGLSGEAILNYPAGVTAVPATQVAKAGSFADGAALLEATTTVEGLRAGEGVELKNKTALLQFSVAQAGDVTFEVGTAKYTVTGCKTDETYYACVASSSNVAFKVSVDGYIVKEASKNVTFESNKIAKLGTLPYNVYLHASTEYYDWTNDYARFATWTWGTGVTDSWFDMIAEGHKGVYRLEVSTGYKNLIFCRMKPDSENDWTNKWNQTGDQVILVGKMNHFAINSDGTGIWCDNEGKLKEGYLYLKPNDNWNQDNARFAAYFFGNGEKWVDMTDPDGDGLYEVQKQSGYPSIIFCRMNPSLSANNWDNKWGQTGDLTIGSDNLYTINAGEWKAGAWSSVDMF